MILRSLDVVPFLVNECHSVEKKEDSMYVTFYGFIKLCPSILASQVGIWHHDITIILPATPKCSSMSSRNV